MEWDWSYQPAPPKGEGLHTRGRHQMETNRRGCCKQPVPCSQRKGITSQLFQKEKGCTHEGITMETNRRGCCKQPVPCPKERCYQPAFPKGKGLHTRGRHHGNESSWFILPYLTVLTYFILGEVEAMEGAWSYQPASPKGEGLHTRGRHQMETNRRGCCKQPVPCSQRKGITNQLFQKEKGCTHEGVTMETNRRGCCKQPTMPQRKGVTNQLFQKEKGCTHEGVTMETNRLEAMEGAWSFQPASPKGEGLHTRGRHQMETNRRECCKQPVPCSQRKGITSQLLVVGVVRNQFRAPQKSVDIS
ncbi:hypothetical protein F8M41_010796 [Gigaspora margarita]|uniref:Uncharacterized protein n=1 Tax=Gigaspora margarita TaxID=4874 RepID=A0A8H4EQ95_GIGMA|nr:hypothetical protein F8M41_010796 [Gigaspora margarita]